MTDHRTRSDHEARTYELFAQWRDSHEFDSSAQVVAMVFQAMWYSSLSVERVKAIGEAMACLREWDPQPILTRLARDKVLRSTVERGVRYYEVNY